MAEKSLALSQAQAFSDMGMDDTARPLRFRAASYEEQIAPLLDVFGRDSEAAIHRVSAASCFKKCDKWSRAANLYQAALAGPLTDAVRADVELELSVCLQHLRQTVVESAT